MPSFPEAMLSVEFLVSERFVHTVKVFAEYRVRLLLFILSELLFCLCLVLRFWYTLC